LYTNQIFKNNTNKSAAFLTSSENIFLLNKGLSMIHASLLTRNSRLINSSPFSTSINMTINSIEVYKWHQDKTVRLSMLVTNLNATFLLTLSALVAALLMTTSTTTMA